MLSDSFEILKAKLRLLDNGFKDGDKKCIMPYLLFTYHILSANDNTVVIVFQFRAVPVTPILSSKKFVYNFVRPKPLGQYRKISFPEIRYLSGG